MPAEPNPDRLKRDKGALMQTPFACVFFAVLTTKQGHTGGPLRGLSPVALFRRLRLPKPSQRTAALSLACWLVRWCEKMPRLKAQP